MPAVSKPNVPYCGLPATAAWAVAGAENETKVAAASAVDARATANSLTISENPSEYAGYLWKRAPNGANVNRVTANLTASSLGSRSAVPPFAERPISPGKRCEQIAGDRNADCHCQDPQRDWSGCMVNPE